MRDETTGSVAVRRRSRVWPLNSPWWIPSIKQTSRRCRVEPEVQRVASNSVCGCNRKNIFQNMQGLKGRGTRLSWWQRKPKRNREIKLQFFGVSFATRGPTAVFSMLASAASECSGANRRRWRTLWNPLWPAVQQWPGHPATFCSPDWRPPAPHLSLLHHP